MRYYEDMRTKFGFSEGQAIPRGIEEVRALYIGVINRYAEKFGSEYRAVAHFGAGYNYCRIMFLKLSDIDPKWDLTTSETTYKRSELLVEKPDDMMSAAITMADGEELDQYVELEVSVDFAEFYFHDFADEVSDDA